MVRIIRGKGKNAFAPKKVKIIGEKEDVKSKLNEIWEREKIILEVQGEIERYAEDLKKKEESIVKREKELKSLISYLKGIKKIKKEDMKKIKEMSKGRTKIENEEINKKMNKLKERNRELVENVYKIVQDIENI